MVRPFFDQVARRGVSRALLAALALAAVGALAVPTLAPAAVHADPSTPYVRWTPGPDAVPVATHPSEVVGVVEQPGGVAPAGAGVLIRGWVVDRYSAGRPDKVRVYDGPLPSLAAGKLVLEAQTYIWRREPEYLFGSSAYKASGFEGTIPAGALASGPHTLTVAAHFDWLGWWTTTVPLTLTGPVTPVPTVVTPIPLPTASSNVGQVVGITCVPPTSPESAPTIEVAVTSQRPFPVRDALVWLRIGPVRSGLSRYGDDGDTHNLVFSFEPAALTGASAGDRVVVSYGDGEEAPAGDTWELGAWGGVPLPECLGAGT